MVQEPDKRKRNWLVGLGAAILAGISALASMLPKISNTSALGGIEEEHKPKPSIPSPTPQDHERAPETPPNEITQEQTAEQPQDTVENHEVQEHSKYYTLVIDAHILREVEFKQIVLTPDNAEQYLDILTNEAGNPRPELEQIRMMQALMSERIVNLFNSEVKKELDDKGIPHVVIVKSICDFFDKPPAESVFAQIPEEARKKLSALAKLAIPEDLGTRSIVVPKLVGIDLLKEIPENAEIVDCRVANIPPYLPDGATTLTFNLIDRTIEKGAIDHDALLIAKLAVKWALDAEKMEYGSPEQTKIITNLLEAPRVFAEEYPPRIDCDGEIECHLPSSSISGAKTAELVVHDPAHVHK